MSKRPNALEVEHSHKRQQTHDPRGNSALDISSYALIRIAGQADELINCLQSLQRQLEQNQNPQESPQLQETKKRLSRLSKRLLPSFQALQSNDRSDAIVSGGGSSFDEEALNHQQQEDSCQNTSSPQPQSLENYQSVVAADLPIPSVITVTPWVSSEIKPGWPLLPPILNPALADEAFTHPGLGRKLNYERLEWLGDAYLELIATALIHQTFGHLPSGRCSQLRERLIRNVTLAEYFRHYGMTRWAKLPDNFNENRGLGRGRSNDKDLRKTQADMFEAYVAAVVLSEQNGLAKVTEFLKAIWGRTILDEIKKAEAAKRETSNNKESTGKDNASSAKERLSQKIVVKGVTILYKDLPCEKKDKLGLPLYSIGVYLDGWGEMGRLLAVGTALSKKEAGQKAAETALQNRRLMRAYEEKKKVYMEARDNNS